MLPSGIALYHPPMATIPVAAKAPARSATGPKFPKSQDGTTVSPARDRGEANPLPVEHCTAKRSANDYGTTSY